MLYHLLYFLRDPFSWLNVFRYQTFRSMLAFLFAFAFVLLLQPLFIAWLKARGVKGQPVRNEIIESHIKKEGVPTLGGLLVALGIIFATFLFADLTNKFIWLSSLVLSGFAFLGFVDDWAKIAKQNYTGVSESGKIITQITITLAALLFLYFSEFSLDLRFPFLKEFALPLGVLFLFFAGFVIIGSSNAVNFTDGLDGLAIGPVITVCATYGIFAYLTGNKSYAEYLGLSYVAGVGELAIVLAAAIGAGLGFLWYNSFPAQVFMGDTGSLSLGALIGFAAVAVKQEILLVVCGGIFVLEAISVILQRYYLKYKQHGFFKMAPIHHHFELLGWPEQKIVVRAWIVSIVLAIISLTTLKLR
ncbi:MAG TPA: phospho-N-acetylmuramoyl-pentapeptide-transferase [Oligoflexia bacterium]|nr:phospho-N-acetylmuramoyl-pentapeptide-transferase [Oligoflexia bacterium]HMP27756.1 phospho-N-acetylmuramoyl-pentapeptide-transferase [Oligoflexia bacterium]